MKRKSIWKPLIGIGIGSFLGVILKTGNIGIALDRTIIAVISSFIVIYIFEYYDLND